MFSDDLPLTVGRLNFYTEDRFYFYIDAHADNSVFGLYLLFIKAKNPVFKVNYLFAPYKFITILSICFKSFQTTPRRDGVV